MEGQPRIFVRVGLWLQMTEEEIRQMIADKGNRLVYIERAMAKDNGELEYGDTYISSAAVSNYNEENGTLIECNDDIDIY